MCQKANEFPSSENPSSTFNNNTPYPSEDFYNPKMAIEEKENEEEKILQNSQKSINISFSQNKIDNNENKNHKIYILKNNFQNDTTNQNTEKKISNIIFSTTKFEKKEIEQKIEIEPKIEIQPKIEIKNNKKIRKDTLRISYVTHFFKDSIVSSSNCFLTSTFFSLQFCNSFSFWELTTFGFCLMNTLL